MVAALGAIVHFGEHQIRIIKPRAETTLARLEATRNPAASRAGVR
ncbi:hypothetical protein [Pararhodobacter sp.]|nr:hypothetical protein [Pararhodobacter sp.]